MESNLDDLRSAQLWRAVVAEFVGTLMLVVVGCGSCLPRPSPPTDLEISLTFGLTVATVVWIIAHVSGGHINPAVSIGMLITRRISLARGVLYMLVQTGGAVLGAAILAGLTPLDQRGALGQTGVAGEVGQGRGFVIEMFISFVLVLTVFASTDNKRGDLNGSAPLAIGLSVTACHLYAVKYTGAGMNPARSFGPALIMNNFPNHWLYWFGPLLGGVIGGLFYETLLAANASLAKARAYLLTSTYDPVDYEASPPPSAPRRRGVVKSPSCGTEEQVDESLITTIRLEKT